MAESYLDSLLGSTVKESDHYPSISGMELHSELRHCLLTPPSVSTFRVNTLNYTVQNAQDILSDLISRQKKFKVLHSSSMLLHPLIDDVIAIENQGPRCELVKQDKKIIVGVECGNSVLRGADVYVPGVLGAPKALTKGDYVSVYSDIDRKCLQGMTGVYTGSTMFVGNGYSMVNREDLFGQRRLRNGIAVSMDDALYVSPSFSGDQLQDVMFLQNLPSIVVAHVLNPKPHERVFDMCAAPGGKTVHIATLMKDMGEVIAFDKSSAKVTKLQENIRRFNLTCVQCFKFDATKAVLAISTGEVDRGLPPYVPNSFDKVLVDAPCSGLGQRPQPKWVLGLKDLQSYPCYQKMILKQAISLLKVGGTLVYSTCTYSPEENECQVKWILDEFKNMSLEHQDPSVGYPGLPGFGLSVEDLAKLQRFWPRDVAETICKHVYKGVEYNNSVLFDSIGFFIAKFVKVQ